MIKQDDIQSIQRMRTTNLLFILCSKQNYIPPNFNYALLICLDQVGVRNQQNLYPRIPTTDVAKLLQYSGSWVEHRDGFSL